MAYYMHNIRRLSGHPSYQKGPWLFFLMDFHSNISLFDKRPLPYVTLCNVLLISVPIICKIIYYSVYRIGLAVIQRNVRKFLFLRNWTWWKLYIKVQPLLSIARAEDEMKEKEEELKRAQEQAKADEDKRKQMESQLTDAISEKEKLFAELQAETDRLISAEDKLMHTQTLKDKLEASLNEALEKLESEEHSSEMLDNKVANAEKQIDELNAKNDEMSTNIQRVSRFFAAYGCIVAL